MGKENHQARCSGCGVSHDRTACSGCKVCKLERRMDRMERDRELNKTSGNTFGVTDD